MIVQQPIKPTYLYMTGYAWQKSSVILSRVGRALLKLRLKIFLGLVKLKETRDTVGGSHFVLFFSSAGKLPATAWTHRF